MTDRPFWQDCQIIIITATATAVGAWGFGVVLGWQDYLKIGLLAFLVVLVVTTWTLVYPRLKFPYVQLREALWKIERATQIDLDQNGVVGNPGKERPIVISGNVREPTAFERDLAYFVNEFWEGRHSWREWNGRKRGWEKAQFPSGREVEQVYWERLNQVLLDAGIVQRNSLGTLKPKKSVSLGQAHKRAFQALDSPTPAQR